MPRKKKDEETNTQTTKSKKTKPEADTVAETEGVEAEQEGVDEESTECLIIPVHMIYKGKRYLEGQKLDTTDEEVQEAILMKLLSMLGEE